MAFSFLPDRGAPGKQVAIEKEAEGSASRIYEARPEGSQESGIVRELPGMSHEPRMDVEQAASRLKRTPQPGLGSRSTN